MNIRTKDGLTDVIEGLRSELGAIKEELRVIDMRKPALESRAERIAEAIQTLVGDGSTGDPRFNAIWTVAWTPSLTLPAGNGRSGLPLGIQLVGQRFRDEALLDAAAWVEARLH